MPDFLKGFGFFIGDESAVIRVQDGDMLNSACLAARLISAVLKSNPAHCSYMLNLRFVPNPKD